jgi:hypothetical protein
MNRYRLTCFLLPGALVLPLFAQQAPSLPGIKTNGALQCATCHSVEAKPQGFTSMAHALELASKSGILNSHEILTFKDAKYSYRIEHHEDQILYSVSDGTDTFQAQIEWAFGFGRAGQTYVYRKDGNFYESRVSFYGELNGLDFTIGVQNKKPSNIVEAAGRLMSEPEKPSCFGCHATNARIGNQLTLDKLVPGVQCERCHGSAERHVASMTQGDKTDSSMKRLGAMTTEETSNFCGQCHRTWEEIAGGPKLGVLSVRFQPYRLTESKCYDSDDSRISCTACHNPHREVDAVTKDYDSKCQACHAGSKPTARACHVAQTNCVSCHMPRVEMPGSHHQFTDHRIRVVKANAPYPE